MTDFDDFEVLGADLVETQLDRRGGATDAIGDDHGKSQAKPTLVHIQYQKRNSRKGFTLIQGLPEDLDLNKLAKHMRKLWSCSGVVIHSDEHGDIIQLSGNNRAPVQQLLLEEGLATKQEIKMHGV